jgi:hypothetical protein
MCRDAACEAIKQRYVFMLTRSAAAFGFCGDEADD